MKRKLFRGFVPLLTAIAFSATMASCQKINDFNQTQQNGNVERNASASLAATVVLGGNEHPGRLLASNCFQCHGTNGYGLEHLAGKSANEIIGELNEMKADPIGNEIMNLHARGYTADQIKLIGDFFSKQ